MYTELAVTLILLLPIISPKRWHSFFKSRFLASILSMAGIYFKILFAILMVMFMDALREMFKYSGDNRASAAHDHGAHLDVEMQQHMRLFRAQRNFYISGFALMLCVVIHRLTTLISRLAVTQASEEAALKQAASASQAAASLLEAAEGKDSGDQTKVLLMKNEQISELEAKLEKLEANLTAALQQAEGTKREYDRLLEEHATVQQRGDKKDD